MRHINKYIFQKQSLEKGMSLVEILLAVATFSLLTMAIIGGIIYGVQGPTISGTQIRAQYLLDEGHEVVRNIRDEGNFSDLASGTYILTISGGIWALQPISNPTTESETIDTIFHRYIVIGTGISGKQVNVYVSWDQGTVSRNIEGSRYLSDWQDIATVVTTKKRGLLAYYDGSNGRDALTSRQYDDVANTFGIEEDIAVGAGGNARNVVLKASPIKAEAILAFGDKDGNLDVLCYNSTTNAWTQDFTAVIGGTGKTRRFDIEYEKTTGDAMVVYSTDNHPNNEIAYRTKPGSSSCGAANWSSATNFNAQRTSQAVEWIAAESAQNVGSDRIGIAWADVASDLSASVWNGTSWIAEPTTILENNLEYASTHQDVQSFDIAFETSSGNLMIAWSPHNTNCTAGPTLSASSCIKYSRYTTAWQPTSAVPTVADRGTNIDIAANLLSTSNQIVLGVMDGSSGDSSYAYWSGATWVGTANQNTNVQTPSAGTKLVACGWLNSGAISRSVCTVNGSNTTTVDWVVGNAGVFTTQTSFVPSPLFVNSNPRKWYDFDVNPNSLDTLMFTLSDNGTDLYSKRLVMSSTGTFVWSNTEGGVPLATHLPQSTAKPFGFTFWKVIP